MKVCKLCEMEICTADGQNYCLKCQDIRKANQKAKAKSNRAAMRVAMASLGMKRVKGAMGGVYYE